VFPNPSRRARSAAFRRLIRELWVCHAQCRRRRHGNFPCAALHY
jgi:hypothetical protein